MTPRSRTTPRYGFGTGWPGLVTGAIAALTITLPAQAAVLNDWSFDPATRQLQVTLPTGIAPNFLLLAEPARIILNLPNTQVGDVALVRQYSGAVRSVRVSQFDPNTTRIVVELAPNTILDPRHAELTAAAVPSGQRWTLRPLIVDGAGTAPASPVAATAPSANPPATAATSGGAGGPALPGLPATAEAATVGAAAPPIAPQYTADDGIRTDASALIGAAATAPDQPPDALPIDPFAQRSQPAVSVPPIATSAPPGAAPSQVATPTAGNEDGAIAPTPGPTVTVPPPPTRPATTPPPPARPDPAPEVAEPPFLNTVPPAPTGSGETPGSAVSIPLRVDPPPATTPTATTPPPVAPAAAPPAPAAPAIPAPPPTSATAPTAPPFLEGTETAPPTERRTQPPPPPVREADGTIPFGAPLPEEGKATPAVTPGSELPVGTRLKLRYPGTAPLVLDQVDPWYEVLIVAEPVQDPHTGAILVPEGTQVLGRFEGGNAQGQRFVSQVIIQGANRDALAASSDALGGTTPTGGLLRNTGIGAAAVMVLSGFSGVGLLGGAALGAAATYATGPQVVTIQPGQIIEVEVIMPAPPAAPGS